MCRRWVLTFLNGMTILGFLFARTHRLLPGRNGLCKGVNFGVIGWLLMGLIFFPLIGLGPFAMGTGLGIGPCRAVAGHAADLQHRAGHGLCRARSAEP